MRYNLEFRKSNLITRPQSIKKSKQISGQTILSGQQDLELNPTEFCEKSPHYSD